MLFFIFFLGMYVEGNGEKEFETRRGRRDEEREEGIT